MIVYKLTNKVNNKFYIGITTRCIKERRRNHMRNANPYLSAAIKKYGKKNFIIEQIDTAKSDKELDRKERRYIRELKPHYNFQQGGRKFFRHNEQSKKAIGEYQMVAKLGNKYRLGKTFTQESKDKISNKLKGNSNKLGKTGNKMSDESKAKMSIAKSGENNPAKRPDVREKLRQAALKRYASQ